jgi:flagellin
MSLGVLNNLSAVYAENNLTNTNNSLSKTLQQLSSGSKINSGADDAAGLSLVDGLQANQDALTQSATNSSEGSGLLQVADGALSQVTSLLDRAVTLATEVSNGTLNSSQQGAANQEYQSILSEINNIGSTTTYNQNQVFGGSDVSVYTGDSSSSSASVDSLHFATVSSSSVGDAGGSMKYSAGQGVFVDLQTGAAGATVNGDTVVNATKGTNVMTFATYDASGGGQTVTTTISTNKANETVNDLINQINSSGLGVTASLETNGQATGATGATSLDQGIEIRGNVETGATVSATDSKTDVENTGIGQEVAANTLTSGTLNAYASSGTGSAMISYASTGTGSADLTTYDLSSQSSAQSALTVLNSAVTDVAAQDGYIGAQINTLNSISNVLSTQSENVQSAQNAVQSTDYASASSNMSKYEILSQTGIAALAQANSVQQEVTKLLQ